MTRGGDAKVNPKADNATYTATLPSDFNQTLRNSLTRALESYYAPLEDTPPELKQLLARLDEQPN
jgi:DNA-binding protein Fis